MPMAAPMQLAERCRRLINFFENQTALCPPNPKELDIVVLISKSTALFGVFKSHSSSGVFKLIVGATLPCFIDKTEAIDSNAPPPSKCPVIDLVDEITTSSFFSKTFLIASVSFLSFAGVEVPWAFI